MRPWSSIIDNRKIILLTFWFQMGLKNIQQVFWNVHFRLVNIRTYYYQKNVIFQLACKHYGTLILEEEKKPRFDLLALTTFWNQKKSVHTWVPSTKSDQPILVCTIPYCLLTSVCPQSTEAETLSTQLPTQLGQWIILFTFPSS